MYVRIMAVLVTVLAFTAIQSHSYKPLTNFLVCTSLQLPPASLSAVDDALDGTVSVVWGTGEVGHVQWLYL